MISLGCSTVSLTTQPASLTPNFSLSDDEILPITLQVTVHHYNSRPRQRIERTKCYEMKHLPAGYSLSLYLYWFQRLQLPIWQMAVRVFLRAASSLQIILLG